MSTLITPRSLSQEKHTLRTPTIPVGGANKANNQTRCWPSEQDEGARGLSTSPDEQEPTMKFYIVIYFVFADKCYFVHTHSQCPRVQSNTQMKIQLDQMVRKHRPFSFKRLWCTSLSSSFISAVTILPLVSFVVVIFPFCGSVPVSIAFASAWSTARLQTPLPLC